MRPHQPTPTPHMKGDNRRQRETRPLQSPRRRPHQPTPTPYIKGDNRRQWETTGDKTTSEPKKPTTPTNTKAARSKVALRTPTVNCLGKKHPQNRLLRVSHSVPRIFGTCTCWWFIVVSCSTTNPDHLLKRKHRSSTTFQPVNTWNLQGPLATNIANHASNYLSTDQNADDIPLYWLVYRDPYNGLWNNPYITG